MSMPLTHSLRRIWRRRRRAPFDALPPVTHTAAGKPRRLGVEMEFSGLSLTQLGNLLPEVVGGQVEYVSDYEARVRDTHWGDFVIELDFAFLKALGREQAEDGAEPPNQLEELSEGLLAALARQLVPFEIVAPPIAFDDLEVIDELIARLRRAGARGTRHSPLYAFGVHLNIELADVEAGTLRRYMQAYALLFDWLRERCNPDLSRRLTPYIEPWPGAYARLILRDDYAPDVATLVDDYLRHNPTRNRALDMLPLLSTIDAERVQAVVDDDRVKARPALHYRLPNCQIDEPDWRWRDLWRDWLQVEHLAADGARRGRMMADWREFHGNVVDRLMGDWARQTRKWLLDDDALASR